MGIADDIRAKQRQAAEAKRPASLREEQEASFDSMAQALNQVVPEIAQACRDLKLRDYWGSRIARTWSFHVNQEEVFIKRSGRWEFRSATRKEWGSTNIVDPVELREHLIKQLERRAAER
jgi:hypothetical protein